MLIVDVGAGVAVEERVPGAVVRSFVGGRGLALWLLWRSVSDATRWDDEANALVVSAGPLCGTTEFTGSGRASVVSLSPLTGLPYDSTVGGDFGALLKSSGFDALAVVGRAAKPLRILVDGRAGLVGFEPADDVGEDCYEEASRLTERHTPADGTARHVSVLLPGRAARHSALACLHVSRPTNTGGMRLKQAGRGGLGRVLHAKGVRAIVVCGSGLRADLNQAASAARVAEIGRRFAMEARTLDRRENNLATAGTTHHVEVMNAYGLLPVRNFQAGSDPRAAALFADEWRRRFSPSAGDACSAGCHLSCSKRAEGYEVTTGPNAGQVVSVDGPEYSSCAALGSNCGIFEASAVLEASYYCDAYGVDTNLVRRRLRLRDGVLGARDSERRPHRGPGAAVGQCPRAAGVASRAGGGPGPGRPRRPGRTPHAAGIRGPRLGHPPTCWPTSGCS